MAVEEKLARSYLPKNCCAVKRSLVPENLCQLHQWQLWQEERGGAWPPLLPELAQRCHAAFCEKEGARSQLQLDVAALPDGNAHLRTPPSSQGPLKVLKEKHVASEELIPCYCSWNQAGQQRRGQAGGGAATDPDNEA